MSKPKNKSPAVRCSFTRMAPTESLKANPKNPNKHAGAQIALYAKIIKHHGWRKAITVSKRSGFIVTGHGAWLTAKAEGWPEVPVDVQEFASEADETAHMLADNKLPQLAELNQDEVTALELGLAQDGFDLELVGMDLQEIEKFRTSQYGTETLKEQVDIPESWKILVTCKTEEDQAGLLERLNKEGFECQALIS